nr:MAG TPA: hypothetical protein [Caudoviricetes sp.]
MSTILGNGISIRGGNSRAGARISTTLNDDGTQNVFIEDNVNTIIDTAKSIFSVSYNKVLVPLVGSSTPSGKLEFTYTGEYNERDDGVVELLTSGEFVSLNDQYVDIFLVGGGGGGCSASGTYGSAGGGGGYTKTLLIGLSKDRSYNATIGAGGEGTTASNTTANSGGDTIFGNVSVNGGNGGRTYYANGGTCHSGGNGGSGGGGGAKGGTDGNNGNSYNNNFIFGGKGQGTTTREFGESTGKLYADGGSSSYANEIVDSPSGLGGSGGANCTDGISNTGSGGGACGNAQSTAIAKNGGSGIVCIRLHKKETIIKAGTYTFKNTLTAVISDVTGAFVFSTNSINMIKMVFTTGNILQYWKNTSDYTPVYDNTSWRSDILKTVILPYDTTVDTDFYIWFTSNTTKTS